MIVKLLYFHLDKIQTTIAPKLPNFDFKCKKCKLYLQYDPNKVADEVDLSNQFIENLINDFIFND